MAENQAQLPPGYELIPEEGDLPEGFELEGDAADPTILQKMGQRFMGTDVEDPMPYTRLGTTIASTLGLGALGMKAGAAAGAAGGPVGAGVGAAAGGAVGALTGVVGGTVAPEAVLELSEALGISQPGTRKRLGLSQEDLKTVLEGELLLETATGGGLAAARLGGRAVTRAWTGIGRAESRLAEEATRHGINMMPVQVGRRSMPRSFVSIFGRFPFIAGPLVKQGTKVDRALTTAFENLPARIAIPASMNEVSADVFSHVGQLAKTVDAQFKKEYEEVYKLADQMKIKMQPANTMARAEEIMAKIAAETPNAGLNKRAITPAPSLVDLRGFLHKSVLGMKGEDGVAVPQTLRQMDSLMEAVDEKIGEYVKKEQGLPLKYLEQLRNGIHKDMVDMGRGYRGQMGPGGAGPREIGRRLRAIDNRFSATMTDLFENTTAKRIGTVTKRGMGGLHYQEATRIPIDNLATILMRGDAPSTIDELSKMVPPETMKKLAATVVGRRIETAVEAGAEGSRLNIDRFAKDMGIGSKTSPRYLQTKRLLDVAGGLTMPEVEKVLDLGRAAASVDIPDVSTFIARRATMGGLRSATNAMIPGLAVAGGSAVGQKSMMQVALGGLMFIGGGRLVSKALSNPESARALRYVLQPETSRVGRKAAKWMLFRGAIWGMMDAGEISAEKARELTDAAHTYVDSWEEYEQKQAK